MPFGPGSTPDIVARLIAEHLQQKYPASAFVIENKPGASGNTGTDAVAKADPDGATIGVCDRRPARHQHASVRQAALRSGKGHRAGDAARHACRARLRSIRALGVNSVAELDRAAEEASPANTISVRSATARCRI